MNHFKPFLILAACVFRLQAGEIPENAVNISWWADDKEGAIWALDAADDATAAKGDPRSTTYAGVDLAIFLEERQGNLAEAAAIANKLGPSK